MPTDCPTVLRPAEHHRRLLVSTSPHAGARSRQRAICQIVARLKLAGHWVHVTSDIDELAELAAQWHAAGELRAVIACGGDGTAALVRHRVPLDVPLLPLPMGTENLLGRYLGQEIAPEAVERTIGEGVVVGLDLGVVRRPAAGDGSSDPQYFLMMLSAGFDAEVVRRFQARRRGHVTRGSYLQPTLQTIRSYQYPELRLYCDGEPAPEVAPHRCRWVFAFNLPLYACGWRIVPAADATDAQLDLCTFGSGSFLHTARYLWHVTRGTHFERTDAQHFRTKRFRLEAGEGHEVAYQLDGDCGGVLPVEVDLLPGALRLLVMPEVVTRLGFTVPAVTRNEAAANA